MLSRGGVLAAALLSSSAALAAPSDFQLKADSYLKSTFAADGPGAAVIVVDDGRVVYSAGHGLADIKAKRRITPQTVFRLGSITKQFTSAVILQLADEGRLSLSDPLSKFLADYPKPGADATVAQLLNHTSGIKSYTGIPGWMASGKPATAFTTEQLVAEFRNQPADFAAGTEQRYNNSGYVLLGAIIEKVTGKPWHVAVEERISRPLGLATIRYVEAEAGVPNMASGYMEDDGKVLPARKIHLSVGHAAGSLVGSVEDLARWAEALHKGKVLSPASYARMIAPTVLPSGKSGPYGFGMRPHTIRGRDAVGHGGDIFGFTTSSTYLPKEDLFVAVFANSEDPAVDTDLAMSKLAALAVGDPFPEFRKADVAAAEVEPLLGLYKSEEGARRFYRKDGRLFTRRSGGGDLEVFTAGNDRFFYGPATLAWFEVKRDPSGKHVMTMYQGAAEEAEAAVRTGPVPADAPVAKVARSVLERYVGTYKAPRGMATVALGEDGALTMRLGSQRPVRLLPTSETEFRPDSVDAKVVFHLDGGKVSHVVLHQGGRETRGEKVEG